MKLIIGLGNPGEEYKNNRHNVGHWVIDQIAKTKLAPNAVIKKTDVFMNSSGLSAKKLISQYRLATDDVFIIHDDLDIPLGSFKIQKGVGPKLHYGIASIEKELGTDDFWRVRIGVDNRNPNNRISGEDYVLQDFTFEEKEKLTTVIGKIIKELKEKIKNA